MIKLLTIIGARPQIIKAAAFSRAVKKKFSHQIEEVIVHTGQHYDDNMSQIFFDELQIPAPNYNLNVGSGTHGTQVATMITGIEAILLKEKPNGIILYGDANSSLGGAIAACKIHIPVVHIEAGLRSFNKAMPEEINRIICDHVSTFLFSPTQAGYKNLVNEGFPENNQAPYSINSPKIYYCGDVMYDNSVFYSELAEQKTSILDNLDLKKSSFILATIHRNNNTDEPKRLNALFTALNDIASENKIKTVLPLHPRTAKLLQSNLDASIYNKVIENEYIKIIAPVSFLEMIALEKNASLVITDSGGVQKEAFFFKKPCIILRSETEWVELVNSGSAIIADADISKIKKAFQYLKNQKMLEFPPLFGDGKAAEFICSELVKHIHN